VQFVLNYEEGSENSILHGDPASEAFLSEIVGAQPYAALRHMNMESLYEYGSRAGFWRLHRLFTTRAIPVTVYGVAMALERNPAAVEAMLSAGWEIASHGYRWIDYQLVREEIEREHLHKAIAIHTRVTGSRPLGWYTGRCSPNTRKLVVEEGGTTPKMPSVGLHCRLVGRPRRVAALARFLDYVQGHEWLWLCRRLDIARHWRVHHPYTSSPSISEKG
jgi:peptidoglycan/xylan/chitin deacetylase (PgdA/CDA1 family)